MITPLPFVAVITAGGVIGLALLFRSGLERMDRNIAIAALRNGDIPYGSPHRSMPMWLAYVAVAVAGFAVDGVVVAVLLLVMTVVGVRVIAKLRLRRETERYAYDIPRVLDSYLLSLRSGAGVLAALRDASFAFNGPVEVDLREVVSRVDRGEPLDSALAGWRSRRNVRAVHVFVSCLVLAHQSGGSSAAATEAVRAMVRNSIAVDAAVRANASQAQASASVLALMPPVLAGPTLLFNDASRVFMFHTPIGVVVLLLGVTLDFVGLLWMKALVRKVAP